MFRPSHTPARRQKAAIPHATPPHHQLTSLCMHLPNSPPHSSSSHRSSIPFSITASFNRPRGPCPCCAPCPNPLHPSSISPPPNTSSVVSGDGSCQLPTTNLTIIAQSPSSASVCLCLPPFPTTATDAGRKEASKDEVSSSTDEISTRSRHCDRLVN